MLAQQSSAFIPKPQHSIVIQSTPAVFYPHKYKIEIYI